MIFFTDLRQKVQIYVRIDSRNGLAPDGVKRILETMLTFSLKTILQKEILQSSVFSIDSRNGLSPFGAKSFFETMLAFSSEASKHIWQKLVQYIKGLRSFDTQWMRNNWVSPRRVTKLLFFAHEWHRCDIGSSSCVGWAKILNLSQAKLFISISILFQFVQ